MKNSTRAKDKLVRESRFKGPTEEEIDEKLSRFHVDVKLSICAERGYLKGVKDAIQEGADIFYGNNNPLREAVENEHIDVIKYLLEKGADPTFPGFRPLIIAIRNDANKIVELLLEEIIEHSESGIPPEIEDKAYEEARNPDMYELLDKYITE